MVPMSRVQVRVGMALLLVAVVAGCGSGEAGTTGSAGHSGTTRSARARGPVKSPTAQLVAPLHSGTPATGRDGTGSTAAQGGPHDQASPPYIARVVWVSLPSGRSLQIYPTASGRIALAAGAEAQAWREVLRKAPDAASRGMRAQFDCHWAFARLAAPHKPSWNLEPWRPVVSAQQMYDTGCNPGGPDV